jgi:hypothetical protein
MSTQTESSPRQNRLIVIIGPGRSGTTWLNQLMQAHREICGIDQGETTLFWSLTELWRDSIAKDKSGLERTPAALARHIREFCDELIDRALARSSRPGALFFVEKTPSTSAALPMLRYVFPDAWYIHIVRDGRDVARSMRRHRRFEPRSDLVNSYYWSAQENYSEKYLAGFDKVIHVRYENLHDDPVGELLEIYMRLGLERYPGLAREIAKRCAEPVALYTRETSVGYGKWRRDVNRWRLASMYAGAGDRLLKSGYVDQRELSYWHRQPEYWIAVIRRAAISWGIASRTALDLFRTSVQLNDALAQDSDTLVMPVARPTKRARP